MENTVKITLWDNTVGYLTWDKSDWSKETSVFKFDSSFLEKGLDISPLQMSIKFTCKKSRHTYKKWKSEEHLQRASSRIRRFVAGQLG
jgi:hypothetical protein